jgi:hypothetical protein
MKNFPFCFVILFAVVFNNTVSAQASWRIISSSNGQITSNTPYYLQAIKNGYHLRYKEREYGINLGWGKQPNPDFQFVKQGGGAINCGDKVALFSNAGGYIRYGKRKWGINLIWSQTPVYEWEIRNLDNKKGTPIMPNTSVALYNSVANDFIRFCKRPGVPVVDIAWVLDCPIGYRYPGAINDIPGLNTITRDEVVKFLKKLSEEKKE